MKVKMRMKPIISVLLIVCIVMSMCVPVVHAAPSQPSAYGSVNQFLTAADAPVMGGADVPFNGNGQMSGISHTAGTTGITVQNTGTYKIDYNTCITAGLDAELAVAVNGTVAPSTGIPVLTAVGEVSGSAILSLNAGDVITLRNNSVVPLTLALAPSAGAQMSIAEVSGTVGNAYQWATTADAIVVGGADVPFSTNGPMSSIGHTAGSTTITIPNAGTYKIDYNTSITAGVGAELAVAINGIVAPSTSIPVLTAVGEVSGNVILSLKAGDVITLRNNSAVPLTMALAPAAGAQISITEVSGIMGNAYQLATLADATVVSGADVPFSTNGPMSGIGHLAGTPTMMIANTGTYKIDYNASITAGAGSDLAVAIDGIAAPSPSISLLTATGEISGSVILSLNAGDIVTLQNNSAIALTLALAPSAGAQMSIVPLAVDLPVITTDSGSAAFVAGDNDKSTPVAIDSGVTVTGLNTLTLSSATVAITGGFHSGEDVLSFANDPLYGNIVASYTAATGVLTLTSAGATATVAQWQSALESVTYTNTAVTPNSSTRTVSFTGVDSSGHTSNTATRTVTVADTDQTPIVVTSGGSITYPVGGSAVVIDNGVSISDLDNTTQSSATVSISSGFHSGDTLSFTNTSSTLFGNIVGSYNAATGVLTLTSSGATATVAQWANVLSSVVFSCSSNASTGDRTISFVVNDGTKSSAAAAHTVSVTGLPSITSINPANGSGAGGTSVTITGSGFSGVTAVKFGGTTGSGITVVSDTSLTVTSPAGSGTVDVTVTTPYGTSTVVSSDQFTYVAPNQDQSAPTGLTGIAPTSAANNDGKITGVTDSMEYRLQGAANYTPVPASATVITGLAAGTYQVRLAAGPGLNAGPDADVVVPAYTAQTFLSLGDSIAYGMSAAPGSDYTHLFYNHLLTDPASNQLALNNLAVSGDKSSDLLQRLLTNAQYRASVGNAKVITLSIGGDNLLSPVIASVCTAFGVNPVNNPNLMTQLAAAMAANPNKDAILASLANSPALTQALQAGVTQFGTDFPQIMTAVKTLSPQAQIYVLNLYNPFSEQDPLYSVFDPLIRGINQAINNNAMAGYKVADVYTKFRTTPGAVNFNLATLQLDPHPTTVGHAAIYQALLDAEAGQTPASYYTVSIAPLTGGTITASPTSATSGSAINLSITPNAGMQLQAGSLKYNDGSDHSITGTSFTMPAANVIITAVFETIPNAVHEGGGGSSAGGGSASGGGTTVTGSVLDGTTGGVVANLTATVTTESDGNYTAFMQAPQTLTFQLPDGTTSPLSDLSKVSYVSSAGTSASVSADRTINFANLAKGTDNRYKITYDLGNGQTIALGTLEITVSNNGTVSLKCTLIDPYGIITDAATGKPIAGAKVTLYYANTERNKTNGKTPDTVVALPGIDGFKPNNNQNPQTSDTKGAYGFMVFPDTDYYIVAAKDGYEPYTSPTISVGQDIVHWDFKMSTPITGVNRLAGQSQVDTALAIAKANYTGTLSNVVLATAGNYPDALAGSVLAYKLNAPILLVGTSKADQEKVLDYMKANLAPSGNVYILGGTAVVSADLEAKVKADGFGQITRLGGTDRYETSVKIANQLKVKSGTPIVLAYGDNYPDALSISSIAAENQYPILLVQKDGLSDAVKNEIAAINPSKVYLIGGEGVISAAVENQVEQITTLNKTNIIRIAGQDRYDTSLAVAQYFNLAGQSVCVATGSNFPDALAGSVYAANHNTSIILTDGSLSEQVVNYLKGKKMTGTTIFGGEAVVNKGIEQQLGQLIGK
ncbi:cell wall-binding repeat-containing protein [Desulfosporosinus sp. SYSU MS00001]|uniref:cell wall-binding repeat-containing protein n=1 Tax=Desulfosporosinus sp. SYSU MS00001 TaxID=3416284 RepID=UPI003CF60A2B